MNNDVGAQQFDFLSGGSEPAAKLSVLSSRFVVPPFSVLNARGDEWQERKRAWLSLGIGGDASREEVDTYKSTGFMGDLIAARGGNVSLFDPVLAEIAYRWFCPEGGMAIDPFAGGPVRGLVASHLGRNYWGVDLRQEQVDANRAAAVGWAIQPVWEVGDAQDAMAAAPSADLIIACPPYGDLEVYCDDPRDLSNMTLVGFRDAYSKVIRACSMRLKPNRFAFFVVGDYRAKDGNLQNLPGETIKAFLAAGLSLYNEAILVTPVGTAAPRASAQFAAGGKLCKTHQNVLVFVKGDGKEAAKLCVGAS